MPPRPNRITPTTEPHHTVRAASRVSSHAHVIKQGVKHLLIQGNGPNPLTSFVQPSLLHYRHMGHVGGLVSVSRVLTGRDTALFPKCPSLSPGQEPVATFSPVSF